jgi:hypothetical protein
MAATRRPYLSAVSAAAAAVAVVTAACTFNPPATAGLRECPHKWVRFEVVDPDKRLSPLVTPSTGLALSGPQTDVPEYNDCQRFVVDRKYGSLIAIFAAYQLDSVAAMLDTIGAAQDTSVTMVGKRALPVAIIWNQGPDKYEPLGIEVGFSCLRLFHMGKDLKAKLEYLGMNQGACKPPPDGTVPPGNDLEIRPVKFGLFGAKEFPPVARWDWDPSHGHQYIGILCGEKSWCEVGRPGFVRSLPDLNAPMRFDKEARVRRIKGWYDEQQMDVIPSGGTLQPSTVHAAVIPDPDLGDQNLGSYHNRWVRTGYIALDAPIPDYLTKLNISQVTPGSQLNQMNAIGMCFGTHARCGVDHARLHLNSACTQAMWNDAATERWWARIQAAKDLGTDRYKYFCVIRYTHPTLPMGVPGTARWRWLDDDPSVWEACADGCCEVQARKS